MATENLIAKAGTKERLLTLVASYFSCNENLLYLDQNKLYNKNGKPVIGFKYVAKGKVHKLIQSRFFN